VWSSFTWMSFLAFASQTISLCSFVVNTHIKGRKLGKSSWHVPWFYSDERLDTCCSLFCAHLFTFGLCLVLEWWASC
jgi:hypothetical protein